MWIIQQRYVDIVGQKASIWMNLPDVYLSEEEMQVNLKSRKDVCDKSKEPLFFNYRGLKCEVLDK